MKRALKRTLALVLAVCLCLSAVPAVMAAEPMEPGDIDLSIHATERTGGGYAVRYTASIVMVDWLAKPAAYNCADDRMADLEVVCTLTDPLVDQLTAVDEDDFTFTCAKWEGEDIFVYEDASTVTGGIEIRYSLNPVVLRDWKTAATADVYNALRQKMTMTATKNVTDAQMRAAGNGYTSHAKIDLVGRLMDFYFDQDVVLAHEGTATLRLGSGGGAGGSGKPSLIEDHVAYIIGYEDGTVRPQNNITRAEVATIFFRLLTDESRADYWKTTNSFSDVAKGDWFNNAISTLSNAGIITGYPDGSFKPNASITRAEFAAISVRFSDVVYTQNSSFTDVDASHWAAKYISLAEYLGWVNGYPDGTFRPNNLITRAESMTLINRVLEREVEAANMLKGMRTWPDNAKSAWYYEAVQEATNSHTYERLDREVPGRGFNYEKWLKLTEDPDWKALEYSWSEANDH